MSPRIKVVMKMLQDKKVNGKQCSSKYKQNKLHLQRIITNKSLYVYSLVWLKACGNSTTKLNAAMHN